MRKPKDTGSNTKVAVSACLLGENCRYDGGNRRDEELIKEIKEYDVVSFCPEDNILGTPRETIDLIKKDGSIRAIGNESRKDYTEKIANEAQRFAKRYPDIEKFFLKSKSPSCALCSARVYDENCNLLKSDETGIFAKKLKEFYKNAEFVERNP
ncbi:DUF523 domain-containing protein [Nitrosophilus alvini]|uniref:DUF523 domain-containing protein n=1 Tax=Nitrosophilus alvini TaxID=2714855 RepID=UPI00190946C3|nr:DUF523 domain-containing protein [Nitrosophilus alvini]